MKMKKRIIVVLVSLAAFILLGVSVFAAFKFTRKVDGTSTSGDAVVNSKSFINYQDSTYTSMRVDTVCRLDDISLVSSISYSTASGTFQSSHTYYVSGTYESAKVTSGNSVTANTYYEDTQGAFTLTSDTTFQYGKTYYTRTSASGYTAITSISIGTTISGTYYEKTVSYSGISSIGKTVAKDGTSLSYSLSTDKKTITITSGSSTVATITVIINSSTGITSASVSEENYYATLDVDGLGMVILDSSKSSDGTVIAATGDNTTMKCSATESKQNSSDIYLNQLGLEFTFTNEIEVYVRIHIQDAWIQTKEYSSNNKQAYSIKDQISGNSPFAVSDSDWYYVASENTAYMKESVKPEKTTDGYTSHTYRFDVNPAYYYVSTTNTSVYKEYIDVEVTFKVDIVQANRAKALWGIDPSTDLS